MVLGHVSDALAAMWFATPTSSFALCCCKSDAAAVTYTDGDISRLGVGLPVWEDGDGGFPSGEAKSLVLRSHIYHFDLDYLLPPLQIDGGWKANWVSNDSQAL